MYSLKRRLCNYCIVLLTHAWCQSLLKTPGSNLGCPCVAPALSLQPVPLPCARKAQICRSHTRGSSQEKKNQMQTVIRFWDWWGPEETLDLVWLVSLGLIQQFHFAVQAGLWGQLHCRYIGLGMRFSKIPI